MENINCNLKNGEEQVNMSPRGLRLEALRSLITVVAHLLIGTIVGVSLIFACKNGIAMGPTSQHIVLCVIGYQLLMAEAILSLAPNSWSSNLSLKNRRRLHWILQVGGSVLALTGCIIKSIHKTTKGINYNTLHGQFGLASMIFTTASLINGLTSLYSYELRHIMPGSISKLTHVCCGVVAYGCASTCLVYGFDKTSFRAWAGTFADVIIILTGALTIIVIVNPLISFYQKFSRVLKF